MYVSRIKKNVSYFFFALIHTNYLSQRRQHFALSFLFSSLHTTLSWLSSFSLSGSILAALSFLFCSNPCCCSLFNMRHTSCCCSQVSPSSCISHKQKSFFSLLVSCFIFCLPIGRTLGPKPSNSL